ncbi:uncharacterized protein DSM5745_06748 [Aspergillus mulundensis]|uniref:Velvet domain-containing protein n=1 Tax=Aspergillus mulundensis TaxID=1810919 RepID=A0A3D8RS36_9EURO|nr:Uncharacterized protein DSM5745_06748 [Aspergillus mulundensis]RDW76756.1 Uncharacterized protein DSM5745_06748 [Aspergillus mulundensis]
MALGLEYSPTFAIEPPTSIRPGVAFSFPIVVAVPPVGNAGNDPEQQLGAIVLLRDETGGDSAAALAATGTAATSVCNRTGNSTSGYAAFRRLTINSPGKYRLRVMLCLSNAREVLVKGSVDSKVIHVHAGAAASQPPTSSQIAKLQALVPENIGISQADIAAWQQA